MDSSRFVREFMVLPSSSLHIYILFCKKILDFYYSRTSMDVYVCACEYDMRVGRPNLQ